MRVVFEWYFHLFLHQKKYWRQIKIVLKRLRKFNFFVNLIKCKFMQKSIEFLNYIINNKNISMNMKKINVIKLWSIFENFKKFQMFLKFANFYKRFIVKYAKILRSFFELFKNNKNEKQIDEFIWNEKTIKIFEKFIRMFIETSMLIHFDFKNKIIIEINVSNLVIIEMIF